MPVSLLPSKLILSPSRILNTISSYSFGFGLFASTLRRIPFLSEILTIPLLISWLIGYSTWYIGTSFYGKDHQRKEDSWYGFAEFRQQHQTAALLGTIATILCFIVPTLIIPTAWLFTISNIFWAIGEHHKKNMPNTNDPKYSTPKQKIYCHLSLLVTTISFITAASTTVVFFIPIIAPILVPIIAAVQAILTVALFCFLGKYLARNFKPDIPKKEVLVNNKKSVEPEMTLDPQEPTCSNGLFQSPDPTGQPETHTSTKALVL